MSEDQTRTSKRKQGFATLPPDRVSYIASLGGRAAHASGRAHEFSKEQARAAGAKGGKGIVAKRGLDYMREIGKRGAAKSAAIRAGKEASNAIVQQGPSDGSPDTRPAVENAVEQHGGL